MIIQKLSDLVISNFKNLSINENILNKQYQHEKQIIKPYNLFKFNFTFSQNLNQEKFKLKNKYQNSNSKKSMVQLIISKNEEIQIKLIFDNSKKKEKKIIIFIVVDIQAIFLLLNIFDNSNIKMKKYNQFKLEKLSKIIRIYKLKISISNFKNLAFNKNIINCIRVRINKQINKENYQILIKTQFYKLQKLQSRDQNQFQFKKVFCLLNKYQN
ncbi:transmembrane protein, putative (macronuclear) [Tetrahymena thermophila SB210]|uniref:Transmembrane protein, putative n=1 Tax=Tetrahymena thermophila (strain SB210) TaxID=312017 RepID=W7X9G6_TETTS|nr:transmembrane protein, putative [Tetrahymena thermophila SB210]EWS76050.1 transmembrane protein, putative [Tetrahymena thermophila SB210]|eukprot:XP_012651419.1 transmembrane protein, putative [Tetrahymena thermophila SB210]